MNAEKAITTLLLCGEEVCLHQFRSCLIDSIAVTISVQVVFFTLGERRNPSTHIVCR